MPIFLPRTLRVERRRHEVSCRMEPYKRVPSPRIVCRPSAVSTSLLSTPTLDVDLHLVFARPRPGIVVATTFVRVSFHAERIAIELSVSTRQVASDADASVLAAAEAVVLGRNPAVFREFVRQAIRVATAGSAN